MIAEFKHVSATGLGSHAEVGHPRWHNPGEIATVVDVLRHVRAASQPRPPTLAILSFYTAQVDKLSERIEVGSEIGS